MPCEPGSQLNLPKKMTAGSSPSDGSDTHQIIWVEFQGRRFGPYWGAADARKEGFILDETPMDKIPYGWPVKWDEIPKLS